MKRDIIEKIYNEELIDYYKNNLNIFNRNTKYSYYKEEILIINKSIYFVKQYVINTLSNFIFIRSEQNIREAIKLDNNIYGMRYETLQMIYDSLIVKKAGKISD